MKVCSWTAFEFISLVRQRAKRTDDYVNGLKWQHHLSTARFRCCKNWSSFYYFKGDPTSSGVKEPREGSPISFSLLHSVQTVMFAGFKIWNLILQADWTQNQLHKRLITSRLPTVECIEDPLLYKERLQTSVQRNVDSFTFYHTSDLE